MKQAWLLIRREPELRLRCFSAGVRAAGYEPHVGRPARMSDCHLLVTWNRYGENHDIAIQVERAGGTVVVTENGYLGFRGESPKWALDSGMRPEHYVALAIGSHHGGVWNSNGPKRFASLEVEVKPWRIDDGTGHYLICPNRSFGTPGRIMPPDWPQATQKLLRTMTSREVRIRGHPGNHRPKRPLEVDLENAFAMIIWNTSVGVNALLAGIPVICEAPGWIMKGACGTMAEVKNPPMPNRLPHFQRMAWCQWTLGEIATGEPFRTLLDHEIAEAA